MSHAVPPGCRHPALRQACVKLKLSNATAHRAANGVHRGKWIDYESEGVKQCAAATIRGQTRSANSTAISHLTQHTNEDRRGSSSLTAPISISYRLSRTCDDVK
mmetsp:Transcript_30074/g.77958  ORF Transcript_30074/g.77958 Transcript_30074/m.77958 type:complete len:104 (-) Transcript_30074:738-1049(-)